MLSADVMAGRHVFISVTPLRQSQRHWHFSLQVMQANTAHLGVLLACLARDMLSLRYIRFKAGAAHVSVDFQPKQCTLWLC